MSQKISPWLHFTGLDGLFESTDRLATFPESGSEIPEIDQHEYRQIIYGSHRVFYRVEPKRISILTVRRAKQRLRHFDTALRLTASSASRRRPAPEGSPSRQAGVIDRRENPSRRRPASEECHLMRNFHGWPSARGVVRMTLLLRR